MKTTTLTAAQKEKLSAAIKQRLDHTLSVDNTAAYPRPKVEPADAFNVLDPNKNNAVNNTYIVIDNIPATYLVSFYWDGDYSIEQVTSEGTQIRVKVPSALVIAAGETVPQPIVVIYSVLNPDEPGGVGSEPLQLTVRKYVRPAYPKPVITEAQGTELDVTALTANAHMTLAAWPDQAVGQKLWLSVASTPPITLQNWNPLTVTTLGAQSRGISKDRLKTLTDGSTFTLKLEASFDDGATRFPFSEQSYTIRSASLNLPEPTVKDAVDGVLDPMKVLSGGTATVAYDGMLATDTITLIWNGDNAAVPSQAGNTRGTVDFLIPVKVLAAVLGKTFDVKYSVERGAEVLPSQSLQLTVSVFAESNLPTPTITEATAGVLELNTFAGDAHVKVAPWPLIAVGQTVWLTVLGPSGVPTIVILAAHLINSAEVAGGITAAVPRAGLETFANGSQLRVVCKIGFGGSNEESSATNLPSAAYTIKNLVIPPFVLDTSAVTLSARVYLNHSSPTWHPPTWPAGTTVTRTPTSGEPPYTYTSANVNIATVNNGLVTPYANGSTTITVRDTQGRSGSFAVTITGVIQCSELGSHKYKEAENMVASRGERMMSLDEGLIITGMYAGTWNQSEYYWTNTGEGLLRHKAIMLRTGANAGTYDSNALYVVGLK